MEKKFKKRTSYKSKCEIFSPNGVVQEDSVYTGEEWMHILVYEVGENSFNDMFEPVINKIKKH